MLYFDFEKSYYKSSYEIMRKMHFWIRLDSARVRKQQQMSKCINIINKIYHIKSLNTKQNCI